MPFGSEQWMYSTGFYPYEIGQSLRFNDDDSAYLSRTPASAGNRKTWTWSGWVKLGAIGAQSIPISVYSSSSNFTRVLFATGNVGAIRFQNTVSNLSSGDVQTNALFRDASAWYHVIISFDATKSAHASGIAIYVNGVEQSLTVNTAITTNQDTSINITTAHYLGAQFAGNSHYDGYVAEVNFIDGQALDATDFGEFKSGVWIPKSYSGTYGTNGFYLDFGNSGSLGADSSGNGNNWTPNNLAATDQVPDSPTNNFCTFNATGTNFNTLSEGNLKNTLTGTNAYVDGTFSISSGKWYWEMLINTSFEQWCGVIEAHHDPRYRANSSGVDYALYIRDGRSYVNGTLSSFGSAYTSGDILGFAFDADSGTLQCFKNSASQGTITGIDTTATWVAQVNSGSDGNTHVQTANFGQDSSFAGNKTAQGNTDANGIGDFYYAPPAGYLALCTANLPDPVIDPAQDDVPADYFNTVLYTGNGSTQSITGAGFQPDFTWIKERTSTSTARLYDVIRGVNKYLQSSTTDAEGTNASNGLTSFDADGFSLGSNTAVNESGIAHVAWNWKAGGTGVSNTDGTITSTVSANEKAGFSIVSYTGNGTSNQTVGHGLNATPAMIIVKNRDVFTYTNWISWHKGLAANNNVQLDTTTAAYNFVTGSSYGGVGSSPTTSTFLLQNGTSTNQNVNDSGDRFIAYVFAEVEGFSKFGSYTGNGSSDGPFVYTGFRPAFVMIKRTDSTGSWWIHDTARNTYNVVDNYLFADASNAEASYDNLDMLSNGFKLRLATYQPNTASASFIYMAFAEMPFKYSNAR